ncbi:MAG: hypothetical protein KJT03_14320, partial [Verrucomicrobiae bacterium]|nr:hypothetical protein [Verrucomicrobiae bacterium]
ENFVIIWVRAYEGNSIRTRYYQSTDFSEWQEFFSPQVDFSNGAFFADEIFVVNGPNGGSFTADFSNWNRLPGSGAAFDLIRFSGSFYVATDSGVYKSSNGLDWEVTRGQARSESRFKAVGNTLSLVDSFGAWETSDGVNWVFQPRNDSATHESELLSLAHGSSGYLGLTPEFIARSQDGISWEFESKPGFLANSIAFGKGVYVSNTSSREIAVSSDGVEWELNQIVDGGVSWNPQSIHYLESAGIFVIDNQNFYFTSPDGSDWTMRNFHEDYSGNLKKVGELIFGQIRPGNLRRGDTITYGTGDGINWQPMPGLGPTNFIFYQNGYYLAGGNHEDTPLLRSENGVDWSTLNIPASGIGYPLHIDENGFYVAFGEETHYDRYFFTENGENWIELPPFDWVGKVFMVNDQIFYSRPQFQWVTTDDLRVSHITLNGGTFGVGDSLEVTLTISNLGNRDAELTGVEVWSTLGKVEGWDGSKPLTPAILNSFVIHAGESAEVPVTFEIPQGTTPGSYGLQVWLNPTQVYAETTVQNNYAWSGGLQIEIPSVGLEIQNSSGGSVFSIPANNDYALGESVSLVAVALPKFRLMKWEGVDFANADSATVILNGDKMVGAEFNRVFYPEISTIGMGKVYIQPEKPYFLSGEVVTVSAEADEGWLFNGWLGPLNGVNAVESFEIQSDILLTAKFGQTLEGWKTSTFSAAELGDENISGNSADADHDGFSTVMEFHFGTDPLDRTDYPEFALARDGNNLVFSYEVGVSSSGFELTAEESSDLISWYPIDSLIEILGTNNGKVLAALSIQYANGLDSFFRLRLVEK